MSRIVLRILSLLISLWAILTISFFIMRIAPGGPFSAEKRPPREIEENFMRVYGLGDDLFTQYLKTIKSFLSLDFGVTYTSYGQRKVIENIKESIGISMELGIYALIITIFSGFLGGFIGGITKNRFLFHAINICSTAGIALPLIVLAPILLLLFNVWIPLFPAGGWENFSDKILPSFTLGFVYFAVISRLAMAGVKDAIEMPHIINVKVIGKGRIGIFKHTIKFALLPVVSFLSPAVASILTGSIVVERIFYIPGISHYFVDGALSRDYPMVMGVVLVYSVFLLILNFIVDLIYPLLDPRMTKKEIKIK